MSSLINRKLKDKNDCVYTNLRLLSIYLYTELKIIIDCLQNNAASS